MWTTSFFICNLPHMMPKKMFVWAFSLCIGLPQAHFCIQALDLMGVLDKIPKSDVIEWIYSLQVEPDPAGN